MAITELKAAEGRLAGMADLGDPKTVLRHYLQLTRDSLIWKLDGLGERDARLPRTPTGNNLLGVLKHCLNVEAGYFGPTFGREFPTPEQLVPMEAYEQDPQADWYAREDETKDGLIDLYRRVGAFADQTIEQLPLDAPGRVPWWRPGRQDVTLQRILVHVIYDPFPSRRSRRHHARAARPGDRLAAAEPQRPRRLRLVGVRRQADPTRRPVRIAGRTPVHPRETRER